MKNLIKMNLKLISANLVKGFLFSGIMGLALPSCSLLENNMNASNLENENELTESLNAQRKMREILEQSNRKIYKELIEKETKIKELENELKEATEALDSLKNYVNRNLMPKIQSLNEENKNFKILLCGSQ